MPNRTFPPAIAPIHSIPFPNHLDMKLTNSIPLVRLQSDNFEVVKIEIVFNAGRVFEKKRMVSKATNLLLKSGSKSMTSAEINEKIDFYGATVGLPINFDYGAVVLYCLTQYVADLLPFVIDLIANPTFPEKELSFYKEQNKSKLTLALDNVDTVAFRSITEEIFGGEHPYGYNSQAEDYDALTREDLIEHHQRLYTSSNCNVFISGNLLEKDLDLLKKEIQHLPKGVEVAPNRIKAPISLARSLKIPLKEKVQVAIRIGRRLFNRRHQDFQKVYLFGILLGGYFGSRLSTSIREEKGYTYGIHSTMDAMVHDGCFLISTEVAQEYAELTLTAIYEEIADLRENEVSDDELQQMKSYLQGYLMNSVDGVFRSSTVVRGLIESGVGKEYFNSLQTVLENLSPKDIRDVAVQYFQKEDLFEVVVG